MQPSFRAKTGQKLFTKLPRTSSVPVSSHFGTDSYVFLVAFRACAIDLIRALGGRGEQNHVARYPAHARLDEALRHGAQGQGEPATGSTSH
jgi:hypothetical protein